MRTDIFTPLIHAFKRRGTVWPGYADAGTRDMYFTRPLDAGIILYHVNGFHEHFRQLDAGDLVTLAKSVALCAREADNDDAIFYIDGGAAQTADGEEAKAEIINCVVAAAAFLGLEDKK